MDEENELTGQPEEAAEGAEAVAEAPPAAPPEPAAEPEAAEPDTPAVRAAAPELEVGPDGMVLVDRLGVPGQTVAGDVDQVLVLGVPETARQRLTSAGVKRLVDRLDQAESPDVAVVSTRLSRAEVTTLVNRVRASLDCPLVVLAHTGGESLAVEIMRLGAVGVIAEGNEAALGAFLTGEGHDVTLLETYDRQSTDTDHGDDAERDDVTGLPGEGAFRQHLTDSVQAGDIPRVAYARVLNLEDASRRLAPAATALLRRRLAARYRELCRGAGAELYAIALADFAIMSEQLTPHAVEALATRLTQATESFAPSGQRTLALAIGHAGPEAATEMALLVELAQRALVVAASAQRSGVVGAESLALGISSTTELEAAERLVAFVEQNDGHAPGHGERVARLAGALAKELGYEGMARSQVRLAALLHDVGKVAIPVEAMAGPEGLSGDALWAYRSHPVRGADYLRVSAGEEVAEAVRAHHERWDGDGFPDGLAGEQIPPAARILALADRFDALRHGGPQLPAQPLDGVLAALRDDAGTRLDPQMVRAATALLPALEAEWNAREVVLRSAETRVPA